MAVGDILVGLDIGFSDLNLVVARVNDFNQLDTIFSSSYESKNFDKDLRLKKESLREGLAIILKEIEDKHDLKIKSSYVTIPGIYVDVQQKENIVTVENPLKGVTEEDIFKAIEDVRLTSSKTFYTDIDIIPYKFILDNGKYVTSPIGNHSKNIVMLSQVVYAKNEFIDDIFEVFDEFDLMVDGFVPVGFGQKEVFISGRKHKNSVMILDFTEDYIEINLFLNDAFVYADTLPVGLNVISKVISHTIEISEEEAKKLRRQYPLALKSYIENDNNIMLVTSKSLDYDKRTIKTSHLIGIIEDTLKKIFEKINKDISKKGYKKLIDTIVLTGDILNISQSDLLATAVFNTSIREERQNRYIVLEDKFFRAYSSLKYISKDKDLNLEYSSIVEKKEQKNTLKKILESIKDFFYS